MSDSDFILDFDNDYNAYEILGLENNCKMKIELNQIIINLH